MGLISLNGGRRFSVFVSPCGLGRLPIICLVEGPQQVCELLTAILDTEHVLETAAQHVELCLVEERNCYRSFAVIHYPAVPFATGV